MRAQSAKIEEELVYFDDPQLLFLTSSRNRSAFAVAVNRPDMRQPFFCCEATEKVSDKYFDGKADLHYVFTQAFSRAYYFFDLATEQNDEVKLVVAKKEDIANHLYWPAPGFFSRSHTNPLRGGAVQLSSATQSYAIDGKWGASDFSRFHGKMSDLYALFAVLERLEGAAAPAEKAFLSGSIRDRLWQGGGSYVGFYDTLFGHNKLHGIAPLDVARIQYASPGSIDLRGDPAALLFTANVISNFDAESLELKKLHDSVRGALKKAKLLGAAPDSPFPSPAISTFVENQARALAAALMLKQVDEIFAACGKNTLVFAKLMLSIYRRANELHLFEAEGRVQRA